MRREGLFQALGRALAEDFRSRSRCRYTFVKEQRQACADRHEQFKIIGRIWLFRSLRSQHEKSLPLIKRFGYWHENFDTGLPYGPQFIAWQLLLQPVPASRLTLHRLA